MDLDKMNVRKSTTKIRSIVKQNHSLSPHRLLAFPFFVSILSLLLTNVSIAEARENQNSSQSSTKNSKNEPYESNLSGFYFGGFGGWGFNSFDIAQKGIAFYLSRQGGPLVVDSDGDTNSKGFGFGGIHFGYEWLSKNNKDWHVTPGIELEGYYFAETIKAHLVNPTERLDFHEFINTFPMRTGVIIADFTLAFTNPYLTPYVSVGMGAAITSINHAVATQTEFPEPGINHFNTNLDSFGWSFASQIKGGLRYSIFKHMRIFGEYRFLFIAANDYTFGHTEYPGHVATSDWSISFDGTYNHLFSLGIDFPF